MTTNSNDAPHPHLDDAAAELVLGLVSGPERADALGHLSGCHRCRALVEDLSGPADALLLLAPPAEPPAGFESRVLERVAPPRERRRPVVRVLLAAAALVAVVVGVAVLGRDGGPPLALAAGAMVTDDGRVVGEAFVHGGDPSWVFVAVPGWAERDTHAGPSREYYLRLDLVDGTHRRMGEIALDPGNGAWGTAVDVDVQRIAAVSLIESDGTVWCRAELDMGTGS